MSAIDLYIIYVIVSDPEENNTRAPNASSGISDLA